MKSVAADQIKRACQDYGGGGGRPLDPSPCYGTVREFCLAPTLLQFTRFKVVFFSSLDSLINVFTEENNSKGLFKEAEKENI